MRRAFGGLRSKNASTIDSKKAVEKE